MSRDFEPGMDASPFEADHPPTRYVNEQVYHRAANSDLPDESFVMVSRAMRNRDPLTGDDPQPQPVRYSVERDGWGDLALWRYGDGEPVALVTLPDGNDPDDTWKLMVRGAGLDPEYAVVARDELLAVLDDVGSTMRTVNGEVLR